MSHYNLKVEVDQDAGRFDAQQKKKAIFRTSRNNELDPSKTLLQNTCSHPFTTFLNLPS